MATSYSVGPFKFGPNDYGTVAIAAGVLLGVVLLFVFVVVPQSSTKGSTSSSKKEVQAADKEDRKKKSPKSKSDPTAEIGMFQSPDGKRSSRLAAKAATPAKG